MSDASELILVFSAVYLLECLQVVPRGAVAVQTLLGRRFGARNALPMGLKPGTGVVLGMPLPPLGVIFVVDRWPVAFGADGWVGADGTTRPWTEPVDSLEVVETRVEVGGATVATLSSERAADALADAVRRVAAARPAKREAVVDEILGARMDGEGVRERVATFGRAVWPLLIAENLLFLLLFAGAPAVLFTALSGWWLEVACAGLGAWLATLIALVRARRICFPDGDGPPAMRLLLLAVWPVGAIRASDLLGRYFLHDVDPVAAATLLPAEGFRAEARRLLAGLRHDAGHPPGWFEERMERAVLRLLRDEHEDPEALFAPPAPHDATVRAFCPGCRAQYVSGVSRCATCPDLRLLPMRKEARKAEQETGDRQPATGNSKLPDPEI